MRRRADKASAPGRGGRKGETREGVAFYVLTVAAMLLGWQVVIQPLKQRAPVAVAIRVAPQSPLVLSRASEAELAAGRDRNAAALGRDALQRAPFDIRALRVVGLTEARGGRLDQADEMLTLAGNWSLRDDPTHAWLIQRRLRRGDYASAFAHADTLARRRENIRPQIFRLFTIAAAQDTARALPVLAGLLSARPIWRQDYLDSLYATPDNLKVAAGLAILLQAGHAPLTDAELQRFYMAAVNQGQIDAVKVVRAGLNRPPAGALGNGDFESPTAPEPFQWQFVQKSGASSTIQADDGAAGNSALRVEYDGYTGASLTRQRLFLTPGRYRLLAQSRIESGEPEGRMEWRVTCADDGASFLSMPALPEGRRAGQPWRSSGAGFSVPSGCASQWLELRGLPLDGRERMVVWFDRISIVAGGARPA